MVARVELYRHYDVWRDNRLGLLGQVPFKVSLHFAAQ